MINVAGLSNVPISYHFSCFVSKVGAYMSICHISIYIFGYHFENRSMCDLDSLIMAVV